jgi:asparagine synthase (glutamine-hydrolysing)
VSGVVAVWRRDGRPVDRADVARMLERLAPRGPDGGGAWVDGPVALGHRLLRTTPEAAQDRQPLVAARGDLVLAADVRLDDRAGLAADLGFTGSDLDGVGDAELILRAWERWGLETPGRLLGDFALVVWDARRRMLACVRDPIGVRPLYYHRTDRLVAVASEVKALLALGDVPRGIDEVRLAAYLVPGLGDATATWYADIRRLPGGHRLVIGDRDERLEPYWALDPAREVRLGSDDEYAEAFRAVFTDAVRQRLRSSGPVGLALSGGLDSSSVVAVARSLRQAAGQPVLTTYSAVFPTIPACDERAYIDAVASGGGLVTRVLEADRLDPLGDFDRTPWHDDDTLHAPGYYMHWALYRMARAEGVRVFLEGTGGDLAVSHGTGALTDLARHGRWLALLRQAREVGRAFDRSTATVLRGVGAALLPRTARLARWRLRGRGRPWDPLVRADFARRIGLADRLWRREPTPTGDGARAAHWRALRSSALADTLESLDGGAASVGLEVRDPFLDRRVMELCLAFPADQKIRGGRTRVVLRHAIGPLLPPEVRERPGKAPLHRMLPRALAVFGREALEALMRDAARVLGPYVDLDVLHRRYRRYLARESRADMLTVWRIATLTLWLRRTRAAG